MMSSSQMEVDGNKSVVIENTGPGSVSVSLHPLVIMNISEHWTRVRAQEAKSTQGSINLCKIYYMYRFRYRISLILVLGALIGKQKGRNVEVLNSFELVFLMYDDDIIIDREYYSSKEEQCKYKKYKKATF